MQDTPAALGAALLALIATVLVALGYGLLTLPAELMVRALQAPPFGQ